MKSTFERTGYAAIGTPNSCEMYTAVIRQPSYVYKNGRPYALGRIEIEGLGFSCIIKEGYMPLQRGYATANMFFGKVGMRGDYKCLMEKLHTKI